MSLSTFFLIIAIIVIVVMGYFMYKLYNEKIETEEKVNSLNSQIITLQDKINKVSEITNNDNNTNTIANKSLVEKENSIVQTLDANGYKINLYSNNEVEIIPSETDINTIFGGTSIKTNLQKYKVIGFNEKINKMFQANNGTGVDPITFFIMNDGTVLYIQPLEQIMQNNYTIPETFKITGKIKDLNNVIDLKISDENDLLVIAITKDGKEIKCWNQWTENM